MIDHIGRGNMPNLVSRKVKMGDVVIATLRDVREIGAPSLHVPAIVTECIGSKEKPQEAERLAPVAAVVLAGPTVQSVAMIPDAQGRPTPFPLVSPAILTYSKQQTPQTWCWPEDHHNACVTPHLSEAH